MNKGIENFKIHQLAKRLEVFVYRVTKEFPLEEKYRSVDQLRRSSSSTTNNISEAYHRFHFADKINKLFIARGEAGETRDGIVVAGEKGLCSKIKSDFVFEKYTELIKGINGYIKYLRNQKRKINS